MVIKILILLAFSFSLFASIDPHDPKYAWMDRLIEKNFTPFSGGIFLHHINSTAIAHSWIARYKVIQNHVYHVSGGGGKGAGFGLLKYLAETYGLPDLDLLYYEQDGLWNYFNGRAPIFCSSKKKWVSQGLYFIDWYTVLPHSEWEDIAREVNATVEKVPWKEKKDLLIWRGAASDGYYTPENWKNNRRGKLCALGIDYPALIDAKFYKVCWNVCSNEEQVWHAIPQGSWLSYAEQTKYKYQFIVDGLFTTYPGDRWRLLSNSVNFMHESEFGHWFYEALQPWIHFVPVKSDLSDFMEKYLYVRDHPELAEQLAKNAREFALNFLMQEQIAIYCYKALLKYANLQKFRPSL